MNLSDTEIANNASLKNIVEIAEALGISEDCTESYGKYKAKLKADRILSEKTKQGKLILVTAISPTPVGEGKTTTTIGLADGLSRIGKNAMAALREPSLGPVFGMKGGAAGGGYSQVLPMEDINLHFTGDIHAITAANNLLAAILDNHVHQGNRLGVDPRSVTWKRCLDMNDRQLRQIVSGLGGASNGSPREDGFQITAASEVMACLCLAENIEDLNDRLNRIAIGYTYEGAVVTAGQLKAGGAMTALLKDAVKPNLVQTIEHTPALIHGGPFANIAHGCNSVIATKTALALSDYTVTEAGFGADLGAEKFIDIKCRSAGLRPDCCVVVATIRALRHHGGVSKANLKKADPRAVEAGLPNLKRHLDNMLNVFNLKTVVAINLFEGDSAEELESVKTACRELGVTAVVCESFAKGSEGSEELAETVAGLCEEPGEVSFAYESDLSIAAKLEAVAGKIYRAGGVSFTPEAKKQIARLEKNGFGKLPVCVAKTQYSFSDRQGLICAPEDFTITVKSAALSAGAGFIVALTGEIMTMPGLPVAPAAENIGIDSSGMIQGLF